MTKPRLARERLMLPASFRRSPSPSATFCLSLPGPVCNDNLMVPTLDLCTNQRRNVMERWMEQWRADSKKGMISSEHAQPARSDHTILPRNHYRVQSHIMHATIMTKKKPDTDQSAEEHRGVLTCQINQVEAGGSDAGHSFLCAFALQHTGKDAVGTAGVSVGLGGRHMPV